MLHTSIPLIHPTQKALKIIVCVMEVTFLVDLTPELAVKTTN